MTDTRPVLVAPDSFKGTLTAPEVAAAVARGVRAGGLAADECPVADGGEGTAEILLDALGGTTFAVEVRGPLGAPVQGRVTLLGDGRRAVVETASASGLGLVAARDRDPWAATTHGTGQLIGAAVDAGATEVLVAAGGSATVDGGRGALDALAGAVGLSGARVVVLCDVRTPWERSAEVFAPQKGADAAMVRRLAERLDGFAAALARDPRGVPMGGAAGGLAGGLWAALGAELVAGAPYVLDAVGFAGRLRGARAVVVGEGRLDHQSLEGKIVGEIAARAAAAGVPVHAIVGSAAPAAGTALASVTEASSLAEIEAAGAALAARIA